MYQSSLILIHPTQPHEPTTLRHGLPNALSRHLFWDLRGPAGAGQSGRLDSTGGSNRSTLRLGKLGRSPRSLTCLLGSFFPPGSLWPSIGLPFPKTLTRSRKCWDRNRNVVWLFCFPTRMLRAKFYSSGFYTWQTACACPGTPETCSTFCFDPLIHHYSDENTIIAQIFTHLFTNYVPGITAGVQGVKCSFFTERFLLYKRERPKKRQVNQ